MGKGLKAVWDEFSTLSKAVLYVCYVHIMEYTNTASHRVENSAHTAFRPFPIRYCTFHYINVGCPKDKFIDI
jgi:hypothetical protein